MMNLLRRHAPWWARRGVRYVTYRALDMLDATRGGRPPMVPPRVVRLVVGGGDFVSVGNEIAGQLVETGGLAPTDRVLEIGSGYGRIARGLTEVLTSGSYDGVEIMGDAVEWSTREITSRFPRFRFHHAEVANAYADAYAKTGGGKATDYVLPFEAASFDFVFLTSVFTHMRPPEIAHYLHEIGRVLKPGGRLFATYYLLDEFSLSQMELGNTFHNFPHQFDGFRATRKDQQEAAVAIPVMDMHRMHSDAGLEVACPLLYGSWSGRSEYLSGQDAVLATKPHAIA